MNKEDSFPTELEGRRELREMEAVVEERLYASAAAGLVPYLGFCITILEL